MAEVIFPEGIRYYAPNEKAPDFIKGNIVLYRDDLIKWLQTQEEQVRLDVKESKGGKIYLSVNTYKKGQHDDVKAIREQAQAIHVAEEDISPDEIPF